MTTKTRGDNSVNYSALALTTAAALSTITVNGLVASRQSIAGEWTNDPAGTYSYSSADDKEISGTANTTARGYARATSTLSGGSCVVDSYASADTARNWFGTVSVSARPMLANAKGAKAKRHGLPSPGQNAVQGTYRASADIRLSFESSCTASGATAVAAGGGSADAACGMAQPGSYTVSLPNIGCNTNGGQPYSLTFTSPDGRGISFSSVTAGLGRYDSGGPGLTLIIITPAKSKQSGKPFFFHRTAVLPAE